MKNLRVLYVEDSQMARSVVGEFLAEIVTHLEVANDGEDALEKFKSGRFDVLITDLRMPNMDGFSLISEIRKLSEDVNIVIVSAFQGEHEISESSKFNIFEFLKKPLDLDDLEKVELLNSISFTYTTEMAKDIKEIYDFEIEALAKKLIEYKGDALKDTRDNHLVLNVSVDKILENGNNDQFVFTFKFNRVERNK